MYRRKSFIGFVLAAIFLAAVVGISGPSSLAGVANVPPSIILVVLGLTLLLLLVSAWKWKLVLQEVDPNSTYPLFALFKVVLFGLLLGLVVSMEVGSATSRIAYLNRGGRTPIKTATFSVFLDRWFDVLALATLAGPSVLFLVGLIDPFVCLVLMLVPVGLLLTMAFISPRSTVFMFVWAFTSSSQFWSRLFRKRNTEASNVPALDFDTNRARLVQIIGLSYTRVVILGFRSWVVMMAVGIELSSIKTLLLVPAVQLTLMVPLTPGGLGLYEAGWYGVLLLHGATTGDSLAFVVLQRVLSTVSLLALFSSIQAGSWLKKIRVVTASRPQSIRRP